MEYEYHEAANIYSMDRATLKDLAKGIKEKGQQLPIVLLGGKILDGRRRYEACKIAGVEPRFATVEGYTDEEAVDYVYEANSRRRQLNAGQKGRAAAKATKLKLRYEEEAKQKQSEGGAIGGELAGKGRPIGVGPRGPKPKKQGPRTRDKVAKDFGTSGRTVARAIKLDESGIPELGVAVDEDKLSLNKAEKISKYPKEEQKELLDEELKPKSKKARKVRSDKNTWGSLPSKGIIIANNAIDIMKKIPLNDATKKEGFKLLISWLRSNMPK